MRIIIIRYGGPLRKQPKEDDVEDLYIQHVSVKFIVTIEMINVLKQEYY